MASLKTKGDLAELKVATDLLERGYRIAIPYGEDHDFDLILCRDDRLERVQVKHATSDSSVIAVKCYSHSLTNGRVRQTERYTQASIEWLAVYDATSDRCFYIPASELVPAGASSTYGWNTLGTVSDEESDSPTSTPHLKSGGPLFSHRTREDFCFSSKAEHFALDGKQRWPASRVRSGDPIRPSLRPCEDR